MASADLWQQFLGIEERLGRELLQIPPGPKVKYVYNPIDYAVEPHSDFLKQYVNSTKKVLFLGMNPGPWGMAQTGVPFGQVDLASGFLQINPQLPVRRPAPMHPKRPVDGFACKRKEVSGQRFWGLFRDLSSTPDRFSQHCAVYNLCPLMYLQESGKNLTPEDMKAEERNQVSALCRRALIEVIKLLNVEQVVGVGRLAEAQARRALAEDDDGDGSLRDRVRVAGIMHPSPASPAANKGWAAIAGKQLQEIGVMGLLTGE